MASRMPSSPSALRCTVSPDVAVREIVLKPGEFVFAEGRTQLRTLLGSCVAVTFWHPRRRIGAMCHYLLARRHTPKPGPPDFRFAEDVIPLIAQRIRKMELHPRSFVVQMIGGSNMFPDLTLEEVLSIGARNAHEGRRILDTEGFSVTAQDLAGTAQRMVTFELWSGNVWVRQGVNRLQSAQLPTPVELCEERSS